MKNITSRLAIVSVALLASACSTLPTDFESTESHAYTDTADTALGIEAEKISAGSETESTLYLLNEGTDALLTRLLLISLAEKSVDAQYFIWKADDVGKLIMHKLVEAADRGVRVRLLLDEVTMDSDTKKVLFSLDQHQNIQVRIYNPFSSSGGKVAAALTDTYRINRRMHNKSFTADSQYTIVGGRNIEDNYFSANVRSNYADLDIVSVGPIVDEVNTQFDIYWNSQLAVPADVFSNNKSSRESFEETKTMLSDHAVAMRASEYMLDLKDSVLYKRITRQLAGDDPDQDFTGIAHVIYDDPEKTLGKSEFETTYMISLMRPHVQKIENTIELISPYFVPGDDGTEHLTAMVDRGINVRVITNSLASTDGIMAQSGYARKRIELLKAGVELYELKPAAKSKASRSLRRSAEAKSALHAKTYIFDRKEIYIGSFNFDPRSAMINTELGVICEIPEMAEYIASELFDKSVNDAAYRVELVIEDEDVDGVIVPMEKVIWVETVDGQEIRHTVQPETSGWRRFNLNLYSILPIESQL